MEWKIVPKLYLYKNTYTHTVGYKTHTHTHALIGVFQNYYPYKKQYKNQHMWILTEPFAPKSVARGFKLLHDAL